MVHIRVTDLSVAMGLAVTPLMSDCILMLSILGNCKSFKFFLQFEPAGVSCLCGLDHVQVQGHIHDKLHVWTVFQAYGLSNNASCSSSLHYLQLCRDRLEMTTSILFLILWDFEMMSESARCGLSYFWPNFESFLANSIKRRRKHLPYMTAWNWVNLIFDRHFSFCLKM